MLKSIPKKNQIVMDARYPSIYQQVIDMTESLSQRTNHLIQEVEKKVAKQEVVLGGERE